MKTKIKKIIVAALLAMTMVLTACGGSETKNNDKLKIVCTLFPQYDWTREIIGDNDNIELILLCESGSDLHSYQPTADDIITISNCDMFIYGGGISDKWVEDTLKQASNKDMIVINMLDVIGDNAKKEEVVEGMEAHEHTHDDESSEHDEEVEEEHSDSDHDHYFDPTGYDEHIWLSVSNAKLVCGEICTGLCKLDDANKATYEDNLTSYTSKLDELDGKYKAMVEEATFDTILVADRFPFRYLTSEYGINYYAAFVGCSSETEASFETVKFLANKTDELKLTNIIVVDGSTQDVAKTVIESTSSKNQNILVLDSMQAVGKKRIDTGETYLTIMEGNLLVLSEALN
ncbi:MAG: zinc ABC transporter substrate-binding protein [Lachnospiraceae bacterium]|nr:zinc ABC transporter substrate-binding protein [Lachnospiraceae bacterium]